MSQPLDILLIVLDTQRADRLSCYGYEKPTSPHLDAFAQAGTRFSKAIAPAQWTIPSHASLFTGLYPSSHGVLQSYSVLPQDIPTLAERLQNGGYFTAGFCNNPLVGIINNGLRRGFYSFLNYSGWLTDRPNQAGVRSGLVGRYRQFFKRNLAAGLRWFQDAFARSEWLLALSLTPLMVPLWQTALSFKGNTARSLQDVAKLLKDRRGVAADQGIFAFVNLMGAHMPYHPPLSYIERFAPQVLNDRSAQVYLRQFNSDVYGWLAPLAGKLDEHQKEILDGMYDAEVAYQDELLGQFFEQLRQGDRLENTLIIICSDHGEHLGEKQFMGHSLTVYNELVQVPLIIRDPRGIFPAQHTEEAIVSTRCLFHSILNAANLASESEQTFAIEETLKQTYNQPVFSEAVPPQNVINLLKKRQPELIRDRACDRPRRAVWMGPHKLIYQDHPIQMHSGIELYDVDNDPQESVNLRDILPENVEVLQDCLAAFCEENPSGVNAILGETRAIGFDDPEVQDRLRDLGYLED
ncbi:MAG: sulfatase [Prochlorotrichaceae cyanobacterium]|jgi:arylsulfatase A-like enzyme